MFILTFLFFFFPSTEAAKWMFAVATVAAECGVEEHALCGQCGQ